MTARARRLLARGIAVAGLFGVPASAQEGPVEKLQAIARAPVDAGEVDGLSVAVTRAGRPVYSGAFGRADAASGRAMLPSTPLRIASVSKTMTAALAVRLAEEGRLPLDAPLVESLPQLAGWLAPAVTLRHALNHTSGLPDYLDADEARFGETGAPLTAEWTFGVLRQRAPLFGVGERWAYANAGFYLAATAMERVTGRSWAELVRESLAEPLGLGSMTVCDELIADDRLHGYAVTEAGAVEDAFFREEGVMGDGGLCVTADDLAAFARKLEQGELVTADGFAVMCVPTVLANGTSVDYGLGVRLGRLGGHRMWGHTGSIGAYVGALFRFPDDDVTVAVLQNTTSAATDALVLAWHLAEAVLELPPADPGPARPVADAARYVGNYEAVGETRAVSRIRLSDAGILERWRGDSPTPIPLVPLGDDRFGRQDWPRDPIVFHGSPEATGFSVYAAGMFASYYWRVP